MTRIEHNNISSMVMNRHYKSTWFRAIRITGKLGTYFVYNVMFYHSTEQTKHPHLRETGHLDMLCVI